MIADQISAQTRVFVVGVVGMQLPRRCLIVLMHAMEMANTLDVHEGDSDGSVRAVLEYPGCEATRSSSDCENAM